MVVLEAVEIEDRTGVKVVGVVNVVVEMIGIVVHQCQIIKLDTEDVVVAEGVEIRAGVSGIEDRHLLRGATKAAEEEGVDVEPIDRTVTPMMRVITSPWFAVLTAGSLRLIRPPWSRLRSKSRVF